MKTLCKATLVVASLIGGSQHCWAPPMKDAAGKPIENLYSLKKDERLRPSKPLVIQTDTRPTFTREIISMQWRPLDPITFFVIKPKNVRRPSVVLYCYTFPQSSKRFMDDEYCARITASGAAAIGFESALTADRYRNRPMREWFVSEMRESLVSTVHDVQYLLDYAQSRGDLNASSAGFFGTGSGATIGVLAATIEPRIRALDLIGPWCDWPTWMKESKQIAEDERPKLTQRAFLRDIRDLDPLNKISKLNIPIRINHVKEDPTVPDRTIEALRKRLPKSATLTLHEDNIAFYRWTQANSMFGWLPSKLSVR